MAELPQRIAALDVVRGVSVLGILAVNAAYFAAPWYVVGLPTLEPLAVSGADLWSWFAPHVFFELKFITLFSMLFGVSLYLVGGEGGDALREAMLQRRLRWLCVFGAIHGLLIWSGDILLAYGLCGLILAGRRHLAPGQLIVPGVVLMVITEALWLAPGVIAGLAPSDDAFRQAFSQGWATEAIDLARDRAEVQSGLSSATWANMRTWGEDALTIFLIYIPRTCGAMMIGLGLFKLGFFTNKWGRGAYFSAVLAGLAALALIAFQAHVNAQANFPPVHQFGVGAIANTMLAPIVSLGYAAALILLLQARVASRMTDGLAAVGRMAFTNYIAQSLIMTTIFWGGRGFGLYATLDRPSVMAIVPLVWALQWLWSVQWLKHFTMGPLEWGWRCLSARKVFPLRRAATH
jgi:uncharacterized protein